MSLFRLVRRLPALVLFWALASPSYAVPQVMGYAATDPRGAPISSAPPGARVLIGGARLDGSGVVWFNGVPTSGPIERSSTEVLVTVPAAPFYPYRGPVAVRVGDEIAFGPEFTISPPPSPTDPPPPAPTPDGRIQISNLSPGDILRYPVALLRGTVAGSGTDLLQVTNNSSPYLNRVVTTEIYQGQFRVLVELVPGSNTLGLETGGGSTASLTLNYLPMTVPYVVRMIYLTDNTGNTLYPVQKANDPQDYEAKLGTAAKLMQTFTAERLNDKGFGRKTFKLELDSEGRVIVHTLRAPNSAAYYQARTAVQVWSEIYGWIDQQFPMNRGKNLVILAFARWDPVKRQLYGGDALGGGGLATFVHLDMFTWPSSLQDVPHAYTDVTRVDTARIRDDSNGRGTLWSVASTTSGAALHEVGHTFGLDHSSDPLSIMLRGFDYYNRTFVAVEPPTNPSGLSRAVRDTEVPYFDAPRAALLATHPWFQPN